MCADRADRTTLPDNLDTSSPEITLVDKPMVSLDTVARSGITTGIEVKSGEKMQALLESLGNRDDVRTMTLLIAELDHKVLGLIPQKTFFLPIMLTDEGPSVVADRDGLRVVNSSFAEGITTNQSSPPSLENILKTETWRIDPERLEAHLAGALRRFSREAKLALERYQNRFYYDEDLDGEPPFSL